MFRTPVSTPTPAQMLTTKILKRIRVRYSRVLTWSVSLNEMKWDHYWQSKFDVGLGNMSQGIINFKNCMYALPLDQSCPNPTLIDFKENQGFGLHRKLSRVEVPSKGIKHMEIYGQFIYFGWTWTEGAVEKVTVGSKITHFKWGTFTPRRGEMLEWGNICLAAHTLCSSRTFHLLAAQSLVFSTPFLSSLSMCLSSFFLLNTNIPLFSPFLFPFYLTLF